MGKIKQFFMKTLEELRKEIEQIDWKIVEMIDQRLRVVKEIGELKKASGTAVVDLTREKWLKEQHASAAQQYSIDQSLIEKIFQLIIMASRDVQKRI